MVLHGESVQLPTSAPLCVTVRTAAFAAAGEASARTSAAVRTAQRRGDRDRLQEADKDFTFRSKRKASKPFTSQPPGQHASDGSAPFGSRRPCTFPARATQPRPSAKRKMRCTRLRTPPPRRVPARRGDRPRPSYDREIRRAKGSRWSRARPIRTPWVPFCVRHWVQQRFWSL